MSGYRISPCLCKHLCVVAGKNILISLRLPEKFASSELVSDCRREIWRKDWKEFSILVCISFGQDTLADKLYNLFNKLFAS